METGAQVTGAQDTAIRRTGLAAAATWLAPIFLTLLSGQDTMEGRFRGNLSSLLFAPLFLLVAAAVGDWLIDRVLRFKDNFAARWLFATGLGLGAFSIGTLLVGVVCVPPAWAAWAVLVLLNVLLAERAGRLLHILTDRLNGVTKHSWLEVALLALIAALICLNMLRAFSPPMEYDELEYHLAAPAQYVRDGRISFISDNAYASFPANVEMLFLDGMIVRGGVVDGFALGRLINVALGVLAACAAGACASEMFGKRAALPAAAILYTWPQVNSIACVGYVELGLMLYVGLALLAAYNYHRSGRRMAHLVLLGVVSGLAAGCKYPAVLFVCVPAGLWVLAAAKKKVLAHGLVFAAVALGVFVPWLVRNAVNTGNPVYPLLGGTFHASTWSPRKEARWQNAHTPKGGVWTALRKTATERFPNKTSPLTMSVLLVVFLPFAFARREWLAKSGVMLLLTLFCITAWLVFTHRITRFLVPWLVPLVVLNAAGAVAFIRHRVANVAMGLALVALAAFEASATVRVRAPDAELDMLMGQPGAMELAAMMSPPTGFVNSLPDGSRTLFYGEARTLYYTGDIIAPTVFDENPLDQVVRDAVSPEGIRDGLRRLAVTHIYVNLEELHRLQWSYAFRYDGREWHGYCTLFDSEDQKRMFRVFLEKYCVVAWPPKADEHWKQVMDDQFVAVMDNHESKHHPRLPFFVYEVRD